MATRHTKSALPAGTVLHCGGGRYTLGEVISFGGSSVFYAAEKAGSALLFGVKECCPGELAGRLRRESGILFGVDEQADYALAQARARMLREAEISQRVAVVSAKSIPVWDAPEGIAVETAEGTAPAPAGSFLILRQMSRAGMFLPQLLAECALPPEEGHPLRTGGRPGIHTIARILEQTLRGVELVHQAGYLYGDVQPENIFFADIRPEKGDIGFGCLLDFGCSLPLTDEGKTAPVTDRLVFSTPGYTAPEIVWGNDGTLQLTPAADVYSAGRLLLYLLRGRTYYENGKDRMLSERAVLARLLSADGERLGCSGKTLRLLQRILDWSLCLSPDDRYQTAAEMLEDVEELVRLIRPPKNQLALSFSALAEGEFLGREETLQELDRSLRQRRKPVVLWGFAGMGKTELAIEFARRYQRGQAHFVRFRNSVRETVTGPIADAFSGYDRNDASGREKPEEQIYREVLKLLGEQDENDLLILDNMDAGENGFAALRGQQAFRDLCALPMGLLVTTRSQVEGGVEVDTLPQPLLRELMGRFTDLSDDMADALISAVEGHTLTVELMARTLKYSIPRLSPETLLEKLRQGALDDGDLPSVSSVKDREGRVARIQEHLTALFRLSGLPPEERTMLCYALPISELGLAGEDFAGIPDFSQDVLLRLIDRGWIRRGRDNILTLHPLVRETGWQELRPRSWPLLLFAAEKSDCMSDDIGRFSSRETGQVIGYLEGVAAYSGEMQELHTHVFSVIHLLELLESQGRFFYSLSLALQLTTWLEERADMEGFDEQYLYFSHFHCYYAYSILGDPEQARLHEEAAARLEPPPKSDYTVPSWMTPLETEWHRRVQAFDNAKGEMRYSEAIRLGEEARQWGIKHGFDTACLARGLSHVYHDVGDGERAWQLMQAACQEMAQRKQPTLDYFIALLGWAGLCADRPETGRELIARAWAVGNQLHPDARRSGLRFYGPAVIDVLLEENWPEDAAVWQEAMRELESMSTAEGGPVK